MRTNPQLKFFLGLLAFLALSAFVYRLPLVHDRLAWRVDEAVLRIRYALNPPQDVVFVPQPQETRSVSPLPVEELSPSISPINTPSPTATAPAPTDTPPPTAVPPTATPAHSPTPLPPAIHLTGVRYEDQHGRWNYCAPATLSMALSFWDWDGNRDTIGPVVKPDEKDKNVMPYELVDFITSHTDLKVALRMGGDLDLIRSSLNSGFPVMIEKGTYLRDTTGVQSWMGHYQVITGYDDPAQEVIAQDAYVGPDHIVSYEDLIDSWRAFNYTYLLIYPPAREAEVQEILGDNWDENANYRNSAQKASDEIFATEGIDQYFAWFNRGTSLVQLQDYGGAAAAYNEAFNLYPAIPVEERPWRMLWYQTGPYFAYFYTGDYWNVLGLADTTLNAMQSEKNLEETYYWRAMAKAALGDTAGAVQDYQTSLEYHAGFGPAQYQLELLGAAAP